MPRGVYVHKPCSEKTKQKLRLANKGQKRSEESTLRATKTRKCLDLKRGYHHSEETLKKILSNSSFGKYPSHRVGSKHSEETKDRQSIARSKYLAANQSKEPGYHNTKPERQMKKILKELGYEFVHSFVGLKIKHSYPADFYIAKLNLIIETDGVYWHNYPLGNPVDLVRTRELQEAGYKVIRFWEGKFNKEVVQEAIRKIEV